MQIVHIITGLEDGGAEAALYRLCCFETQYRHIVVSMIGEGKYGPLLHHAGIETCCLNMPQGRLTIRGVYRLWQLLRSRQPDVVQTWMYHADLIGGITARLAGIKNICWGIRNSDVHAVSTKLTTRWVMAVCARLSGWVPAKIVCCAANAIQVHTELGYSTHKFVLIPNGYDLNSFQPDRDARTRMRRSLGGDDGLPLLGMIARFDPQKDHGNLMYALSLLKAQAKVFRCVLVGKGLTAENRQLSELIEKYHLTAEIVLLGPRNDIPELMNALDIHILSSAYGEAFPNVLAEAMACGTPCVATDVGDSSRIIGETGWIVPKQDAHALAAAIVTGLQLLNDRWEWALRQQACRNRIVENFSIDKTVSAYQRVWLECRSPGNLPTP